MIRSLITTSAIAFTLPAMAANSITKENTDLDLQYGLSGYTIDGKINTVRIMSTKFYLDGEHRMSDKLKVNFTGGAVLQAGTYNRKGPNTTGPTPSNRLSLKQSNLEWTPYQFLSFKAGAINQGELKSGMLVGSSAFLAAKETLSFGSKKFNVKLIAEQAFANNRDLSSTLPNVDEGLPKFYTEGVYLRSDTKHFEISAHVLHWAYDKLAAGIATEGASRGNTPNNAVASAITGFQYQFAGWYAGGEIEIKLPGNTNLELIGDYIVNDKAPTKQNDGFSGEIAFEFPAFDGMLEFFGGYREIHSDASPAYYSRYDNNRKTHFGGLEWESNNSPLELKLSGSRSLKLKPNPYQANENRFFMEIKSKFEFL